MFLSWNNFYNVLQRLAYAFDSDFNLYRLCLHFIVQNRDNRFMIRREFSLLPRPPRRIVFTGITESFDALDIRVPILTTEGQSLANFTEQVDNQICSSCSRESCLGRAALRTTVLNETDRTSIIMVEGAEVLCPSDGCPLEGPPDSGDREPRPYIPPPPSLRQVMSSPSLL